MSAVSHAASFPCRGCGATDLQFYFALGADGRFRYYRCANCALVNYDLATGLDQEQYATEFIDPTDDRARKNLDKDQTFAFLQRRVPGPGRLLDVGCGAGRVLYLAKRAGWQVKGLELSANLARFAAEKLGVEVQVGDFLTAAPAVTDREAYDVVCLRHVLEHLPDGVGAMARISMLLKPGGYFLAELPNIEGWSKKWIRFAARTGLHRRHYAADFMAGHCNEYCRASFEYLMKRTGFELVHWETYSSKLMANRLLTHIPIGTKGRALARKL